MTDWKPEALTAAHNKLLGRAMSAETIRAALDAAIEAQGLEAEMRENALQYIAAVGQAQENYARGRADAFEEAATFFEVRCGYLWSGVAVAEHIRALAKEPK